MARLDRYMLSQLMVLFGFFSLVLVGVYWVNRAVTLFDQLIGDGQTAKVFLEFTALSLPSVIRLVLPVSAFVASVYATNRLMGESEMVVMQATGFSPFRLARPVLVFGLIVALMMAVLMNLLVPASRTQLSLRSAEITRNITARFLTEGAFLHPSDGITLYVREITPLGELRDIFLSDAREPSQNTTYIKQGRVPLHTFRMDIDYANVFAQTVYGKIGIKVWICKGEVLAKRDLNPNFVSGKPEGAGGERRERRDDRHDRRDDRRGGGGGDRRGGGGGGGDRRGGGGGRRN